MRRGEPLDWGGLVPFVVHPVKVAIVEAMLWVDEPFSAADVDEMHDGALGVSAAAYHLRSLASGLPVLHAYEEESIRGAWGKLYFFRGCTPASRSRKRAA